VRLKSNFFPFRYLEGCIEKPLHVIFRNLYQSQKDDDSFSVLLQLLSEIYALQPRLGYHLLFFLAVKWVVAVSDAVLSDCGLCFIGLRLVLAIGTAAFLSWNNEKVISLRTKKGKKKFLSHDV